MKNPFPSLSDLLCSAAVCVDIDIENPDTIRFDSLDDRCTSKQQANKKMMMHHRHGHDEMNLPSFP
jgi:hypothetical protein